MPENECCCQETLEDPLPQDLGRREVGQQGASWVRDTMLVGTLENGYVRNVPLPRIPLIQSTNQVVGVLIYRNPTNTCYSRIAWIPTYSKLRCLPEGFGTIPVVPFFPLVG